MFPSYAPAHRDLGLCPSTLPLLRSGHCHLLNIRLVHVPAKLTLMLQPRRPRLRELQGRAQRVAGCRGGRRGRAAGAVGRRCATSGGRDYGGRPLRPGFHLDRQQLTTDLRYLKIPRARTVPVPRPLPIQDLLPRNRMVLHYVLFHRNSGTPMPALE